MGIVIDMKNLWLKPNGTYWFRARTPQEYLQLGVETRKIITQTLKTTKYAEARVRADRVWSGLEAGWQAMAGGDTEAAKRNFNNAKRAARDIGVEYRLFADLLKNADLAELTRRVEKITDKAVDQPENLKVVAALGMVAEPSLMISQLPSLYETEMKADLTNKTADQMRVWRGHRNLWTKSFIESVGGDKPLRDITPGDITGFRDTLVERMTQDSGEGKISRATAKKYMTNFIAMIRAINDKEMLGIEIPSRGVSIKASKKGGGTAGERRHPFSREWVETKILAKGALDDLNDEARLIVLMMVNTGARPSELAGLQRHHIDVDSNIPKIHIEPEGRDLKTDVSERTVPLVGVSLEAAREAVRMYDRRDPATVKLPKGGKDGDWVFPRYYGRDRLSALVNKYFTAHGLRETPKTTLYSLRHSLEDRMIEAGVDNRVRRDLFGHAVEGMRYGEGGGDEVRLRAVEKAAAWPSDG